MGIAGVLLIIDVFLFSAYFECKKYMRENVITFYWDKEQNEDRVVYYRGSAECNDNVQYSRFLLIQCDEPLRGLYVKDCSQFAERGEKECLKTELTEKEAIIYGIEFLEYNTIKKLYFKNSLGFRGVVVLAQSGRENPGTVVAKWEITIGAFVYFVNPIHILNMIISKQL